MLTNNIDHAYKYDNQNNYFEVCLYFKCYKNGFFGYIEKYVKLMKNSLNNSLNSEVEWNKKYLSKKFEAVKYCGMISE